MNAFKSYSLLIHSKPLGEKNSKKIDKCQLDGFEMFQCDWFVMMADGPHRFLLFRLKLELHFSLIAAAVAYIMWRSVGQLKKNGVFQSRLHKQLTSVPDDINNTLDPHRPKGHWRVDCQGASKGLFLGLLSLVAGIIVLIIFFVMKVSLFASFSFVRNSFE